MTTSFKKELVACLIGTLVGGFVTYFFLTHQTVTTHSDEYHIHADFFIQVGDEILDLGLPELMTTSGHQLHPHAHLHDENGDVLHMHKENITFAEFLGSLEIELTDNCLVRNEESLCTNENQSLVLFVNNEKWTGNITSYVPQDLDQILLYYGPDESKAKLDQVLNEACIFSGSCPERGVAPPESCGLTCEL